MDPANGAVTVINSEFKTPAAANLDGKCNLWVVNTKTGATRLLTGGKLAVPGGIKLDGDTLWVADLFAFRELNVKSGEVKDVFRM